MSVSRASRSIGRRGLAAGTALALAGAAALAGQPTAMSAPTVGGSGCPVAFPVEELAQGQEVTGLTVSRGTVPETFGGTVLGTMDDGIAPGVDMILVDLSSPEIDRVGGIWSGMSGSPVYGEDGRLVGAVAYGLTWGSSPVAGVTPAAEMHRLLAADDEVEATSGRVRLTPRLTRAAVDAGATRRQAEAGLQRLAVPVAVSGVSGPERVDEVAGRLGIEGARLHATGAASGEPGDVASIVPGGNIGASWAYGDFSAVATGTVTAVCGGQVLAFGHPMSFGGPATMTMHSAHAVHVQADSTAAAFKIANPTGAVGTVDQDRLAGLKGFLGQTPRVTLITTSVASADTGLARTGETRVSVPAFLADASAMALMANQDRVFDRIGAGSAALSFSVSGVDADGAPFVLERANRFVSPWDLSFETVAEVGSAVAAVSTSRFGDVDVDEVRVTAELGDDVRRTRLASVAIRRQGAWVPLEKREVIRVRAGRRIRLQVSLRTAAGETVTRRLVVPVPRRAAWTPRGELRLVGGQRLRWASEEKRPASFAELVGAIAEAPRNDELHARLTMFGETDRGVQVQRSTLLDEVVAGKRIHRVRVSD